MTPLIDAAAVMPGLRLKVEYLNPSLSMKHRCLPPHLFAMARRGEITSATRLAILSAGSAGISVAWAANQIGCRASVFVPPGVPELITSYIEWLGGEVVETPAAQAHAMQAQLLGDPGWKVIEQLSNRALCAHYEVVGLELLAQSESIAAVTVGAGTAASVMGIAAALRQRGVKVYAVEPAEASVLQGQPWQPHRIPGLAPPIRSELFDRTAVDGVISVPSELAWQTARDVMRLTGEPVGPSSGACIHAARQLRDQGLRGEVIAVCSSPMTTALGKTKESRKHESLH